MPSNRLLRYASSTAAAAQQAQRVSATQPAVVVQHVLVCGVSGAPPRGQLL